MSSNLSALKNSLRQKMKQTRAAISPAKRQEKSELIVRQFLSLPQVFKSNALAVYLSFGEEVETQLLVEALLRQGKKIAAPHIHQEKNTMAFLELNDLTQCVRNRFGILEPPATAAVVPSLDIVVVPALAFDAQGYRLGYGGGYYDRWIQSHCAPWLIGFSFAACLVDELPHGENDQRVHSVISEEGLKVF